MRKRTIVISLAVLGAAALAGGALAATGSGSSVRPMEKRFSGAVRFAGPPGISEQAVLNDAAKRLHVTGARLTGALKQAVIDQINAAVKAKRLPAPVAKKMTQQLKQSPGLPLGPALFGFGAGGAQITAVGPPGFAGPPGFFGPPGLLGPPAIMSAAAKYLGVSVVQLMQQLHSGKSLAEIAQAKGKSTSGLEQAIVSAVKSQLDQAVAAGKMPKALEQNFVARLTKMVQAIVNTKARFGAVTVTKGGARVQVRAAGAPLFWLLGGMGPPAVRAYVAPAPG
jgi:hypothetical protein